MRLYPLNPESFTRPCSEHLRSDLQVKRTWPNSRVAKFGNANALLTLVYPGQIAAGGRRPQITGI